MNLKAVRKAQGLSQRELARIVGINASRLSQYEKGRRFPKPDMLVKIADALHCSVDKILRAE